MGGAALAPLASVDTNHSRRVGDPMPAPLVSNSLEFLGLWAKRQNTPPQLGEGVSCQVTEDPDAPRPW